MGFPFTAHPELVEGLFFTSGLTLEEEVQPFDRLRASGKREGLKAANGEEKEVYADD